MGKSDTQVVVRIPKSLRAAYEAEAEETHRSLSQVIREALWAQKPRQRAK